MKNNTENIPEKFKHIAPHPDSEINNALKRIIEAPEFYAISKFVFPEKNPEDLKNMLLNIYSSDDFQIQFMHKAVRRIVANSSDGFTFDGFDKLQSNTPYLFISNHRDIVLDSAILQILLKEHDLPRTEITFGSNLMMSPFIIDFEKSTKCLLCSGEEHDNNSSKIQTCCQNISGLQLHKKNHQSG